MKPTQKQMAFYTIGNAKIYAKPNKMSKPIELTKATREAFIAGLKKDLTLEIACKYIGISQATLADWMVKAEKSQKRCERNEYTHLMRTIKLVSYNEWQQHRGKALSILSTIYSMIGGIL